MNFFIRTFSRKCAQFGLNIKWAVLSKLHLLCPKKKFWRKSLIENYDAEIFNEEFARKFRRLSKIFPVFQQKYFGSVVETSVCLSRGNLWNKIGENFLHGKIPSGFWGRSLWQDCQKCIQSNNLWNSSKTEHVLAELAHWWKKLYQLNKRFSFRNMKYEGKWWSDKVQ